MIRTLRNQSGIAMVTALILLIGLVGIIATAALTTMLEKSVNTNQKVSSRALYAADSGIELTRQRITLFSRDKLDSLVGEWAGNGAIIADPQNFFPVSGITVANTTEPEFTATTLFTFADTSFDVRSQSYNFLYTTTVTGTFKGSAQSVISEGRLRVSATRGSFSDYLLFTDKQNLPDGSKIWLHTSGHFDGRVHTNGQLHFAYFPTFEDLVTSVGQDAWYYNSGSAIELDDDHNGTDDVPNFYGGFRRGVDPIELPQNSYNQERVALGGNPSSAAAVNNSEIRSLLGLPVDTTPPPDGVYVPTNGTSVTGGIYVAGNSDEVKMEVSGGNQVYRIKDSAGAITVVTVNPSTNTTTVDPPTAGPTTYTGQPKGMLYVKGAITDLRGPDRTGSTVHPALQRDHQVTIAAAGDITIQRDLSYEDFDSGRNVLGLFTSGGDLRIGDDAPDDLHIDAFVLASSLKKVFKVDGHNSGDYRGEVHLRGGMVTNYYGAFGTFGGGDMTGYGRDFTYDRRGYVPPFYPMTQVFVADEPQPILLSWREVEL